MMAAHPILIAGKWRPARHRCDYSPHSGRHGDLVDISSGAGRMPNWDPGTPVDVLDVSGKVVNVFVYNGGGWTWDGRNPTGQPVVPGLYIVRARPAGLEPVLLKLGVLR